jgi:hypothetical protein
MAVFFSWVVIERTLKGWWPAWERQLGIGGAVVILVLGLLILKTLRRDLLPTAAELAQRQAEARERAEDERLRRLQEEAAAAFEEERRQRYNARRRERRAELRAQKLQAELAKRERAKKAPPVPQTPKSRLERILEEDDE